MSRVARVVQLLLAELCCMLTLCLAIPVEHRPSHQRLLTSVQPRIPNPDGMLHIYNLPVGQGDAHVVQCPGGTLSIVDMGSSDDGTGGFWGVPELTNFFQGQFDRIRNVVSTHNHYDHYSFIPLVLDPTTADISGLQEIYISCTYTELVTSMKDWLTALGDGESMLRLFNNGGACGPNGIACEPMNLCPDDPQVKVLVMAANYGEQCTVSGGNKNIDSSVIKISWGAFSVMLEADFEDFTSTWSENGPQKQMVDFYGPEIEMTVYKLAHHGATSLANKPVFRDAIRPKGTLVGSNPWYGYEHPRCDVTDAFINYVGTLCKPAVTEPTDPFYCGEHPIAGLPIEDRLQSVYTCGFSNGTIVTRTDNEFAIYSTTPDASTINLIELVTDGTRWGFVNHFSPIVSRQHID